MYGGRSDEGSSDDAGWESGGEEIVDKVCSLSLKKIRSPILKSPTYFQCNF